MEVACHMGGSNRRRAWLPFRSSIRRNRGAIWQPRDSRGVGLSIESHRTVATAFVAAALIVVPAERAAAQSTAEFCLAANQSLSLGIALPRTSARLKAGALRIVAVGSS